MEEKAKERTKIEFLVSALNEMQRTHEIANRFMLEITGRKDEIVDKTTDDTSKASNVCFLELWEKTPHAITDHCKAIQTIFMDLNKRLLQ